ncbi:hypothetical protein CsSME_00047600 [Camellia sinensis var. sinensis]
MSPQNCSFLSFSFFYLGALKLRKERMDKLQWGNRKRLRCVKVKDSVLDKSDDGGAGGGAAAAALRKKTTSRVDRRVVVGADNKQPYLPPPPLQSPHRLARSMLNENRKISTSSSPEKEDRYYTTRGSIIGLDDSSSKLFMEARREDNHNKGVGGGGGGGGGIVWPKLYVTLSSKEKEEDFLAMKGCKLPQRPKKRAKLIQKTLLLVSPGAWLSDLCQERYEVREKKSSKKRPRGLKAMGSMESDSE